MTLNLFILLAFLLVPGGEGEMEQKKKKKKKNSSGCFKSLKIVFNSSSSSSRFSHGKEDRKKKKEEEWEASQRRDHNEAIAVATAAAAKAAVAAVEAAAKVVRLAGYPNLLEEEGEMKNKEEHHPSKEQNAEGSGESGRRRTEDGKLPNYMAATQSAEAKVRIIKIPDKTVASGVKWC